MSVASLVLWTGATAQGDEPLSLAQIAEALSSDQQSESTTIRIDQCEMRVETTHHHACEQDKWIRRTEGAIDLRSVGEAEVNEVYGSYIVSLWPDGLPTQDDINVDATLHYCDGSTFSYETASRWSFSVQEPVNNDALMTLNQHIATNCRDAET